MISRYTINFLLARLKIQLGNNLKTSAAGLQTQQDESEVRDVFAATIYSNALFTLIKRYAISLLWRTSNHEVLLTQWGQ